MATASCWAYLQYTVDVSHILLLYHSTDLLYPFMLHQMADIATIDPIPDRFPVQFKPRDTVATCCFCIPSFKTGRALVVDMENNRSLNTRTRSIALVLYTA